jgi:hypothetical protein
MEASATKSANASLRELLRGMLEPEPGRDYYAISLLGAGDDKFEWSVQSHFAGYSTTRPNRELRAATIVDGPKMKALWDSIGESPLVVHNSAHLAVFVRLGGNALVDRGVAENTLTQLIPRLLEPSEVGREWLLGFVNVSQVAPLELKHAPTPKQRSRVMRRDGHRCRLCGRDSDETVHATLEVHHIAGWGGRGSGLTRDSNLITLCDTCHEGVTFEDSWTLWLRANPDRDLFPDRNYGDRVGEYRRYVHSRLKGANKTLRSKRSARGDSPA